MGLQLQIECTNVCPARCCFCAYPDMADNKTRPQGTMGMGLFRRIIDDAATVPLIEHLTLTGLGESLLDRFLLDRIRYIRTKLPHILIDLYTIGTHLRPAVADGLIAAGLSVLYVSLNATTREQRKEITHLDDYDTVVQQIRYAQQAGAGRMRVIVKGVCSKDLMEPGDNERFMQEWGGSFDQGGAAFLHLEGNWAGRVGPKMRTKPKQACSRALGQIMVLQDGRVSLCCFDGHGEMILGDLNRQTIREVYNGPLALGVREAHISGRRQEIPLCSGCTAI